LGEPSFSDGPEATAFAQSFPFESAAQQSAWWLTIRDLSQGRHWLRADNATGRVFHNVTQCPRELRRFLRIAGESVAEVDIACAQPFFALSLFPQGHPERDSYVAAVTSPDFYGVLFDRMPREKRRVWGTCRAAWETPTSTHRDRFKRHVLRHVFYDVCSKPTPVFDALASVSPWLAGELALRRASKAGASDLARQLQRLESELMLGRVVPRIQKN
jgi:hypothetical protein